MPFFVTLEKWCKYRISVSGLIVDARHASEPIARADGCSSVRTYTGHGTNDLFHCAPNIPHYAKNKAVGIMKPGMVRFSRLRLT